MGVFTQTLQKFSDNGGIYGTDNVGLFSFLAPCYFVGLNNDGSANIGTDATINYVPPRLCMSLNGDPAIPLSALPAGFLLTGVNIALHGSGALAGGYLLIRGAFAPLGEFSKITPTIGIYTNLSDEIVGNNTFMGPLTSGITGPIYPSTNLLDLYLTFRARIEVNGALWTTAILQNIEFRGSYTIFNAHWVLENLTHPNSAGIFAPGDHGKLSAPADPTFDFTTVTSIATKTRTITVFEEQIPERIKFRIAPDAPLDDSTDVGGAITCTQFTGYAAIGPLAVLNTNGSGIYTVSSARRKDTMYINSGVDNQTMDVAIPAPSFKTGFIGG